MAHIKQINTGKGASYVVPVNTKDAKELLQDAFNARDFRDANEKGFKASAKVSVELKDGTKVNGFVNFDKTKGEKGELVLKDGDKVLTAKDIAAQAKTVDGKDGAKYIQASAFVNKPKDSIVKALAEAGGVGAELWTDKKGEISTIKSPNGETLKAPEKKEAPKAKTQEVER
jgi:hypothetical protein